MMKSMLGWPSSSTLGHSDASFQCSEQSIEMQSCYNSSSFGVNTERTPEDGIRTHNYHQEISAHPVPVTRRIRGDSFSGTGGSSRSRGGGGYNSYGGSGICGGNGGDSCSGGSGCGRDTGGSSGETKSIGDCNVGDRCGSVNDKKDRINSDNNYISEINEVSELSHVEKKRLNLNVDITYNRSPHLSQISLETPPIPKQYEHYVCQPKDDTDYVTFKKDFRSVCLAKVKSCPKLVFVKRQHSANNGRKKGVRWKPMVNNIPDRDGNYLRRQTVEILPVTPDPSGAHVLLSSRTNAGELECMNEPIPDAHCLWCRKQNEYREALLKCAVKVDSEQFVNTSVDNVSNSSFTQELCPLHYKTSISESDKSSAVPPSRLVIGSDTLHSTVPRSLPFQERRATVSTLSLTGSEWEAKRWQSRSFWERGFFKRMKHLYSRKGVKTVPATAKRTNLFISNKYSLSQSLPNIPFPHSHSDSLKLAPELLTPMLMNRVMPTVRISDMTSTESEGSSCFASIMEMQEEDQSRRHDYLSNPAEENKNIPMISLNLLVGASEFTSNSVASLSNNSGEHLNTGSQDSSWQSADWTGIIDVDLKGTSTSRDGAEQTTAQKEVCSGSSHEQMNVCASNTLQEVVVDNSTDSQFEKQSNKSVL